MNNLNLHKITTIGFLALLTILVATYFLLINTSEKIYPWEITDNYTQTYDCNANPKNLKSCSTPTKIFFTCSADQMEVCNPIRPWLDYDKRLVVVDTMKEADLAFNLFLQNPPENSTGQPYFYAYKANIRKGIKNNYVDGYSVGGGGRSTTGDYPAWKMDMFIDSLANSLIRIGEIQ